MASTNIARGAASNLQVSDILNSESVMSALSDCGVRLRLRYDNVSLSQSDDTVGSGSSARNNLGGATTFIQSFIPLDDRGSVVAEVSFDHIRKTKHFSKELLLKYSNEIVDSFSIIVRNALMQQKIRQNFVDESVVIKSENRNLKNEMIVMNNIKNLLLIENKDRNYFIGAFHCSDERWVIANT
jgi:mevalonate pyrophosphate decarboxylase